MNKDYYLSGTKIVMRRLFKCDIEEILNCYKDYKKLYYNPINKDFLDHIFMCGEIWGSFFRSELIGCCYYFPIDSAFFKKSASYDAIADFLECTEKYYYMGYVGFRSDSSLKKEDSDVYGGIYQAFLNIAQMQAFRCNYKYILHTIPIKISEYKEKLFACGYSLIKLRGLENLVVHYVFAKSVFNDENIYKTQHDTEIEKVSAENTKKVSALLENGYFGIDYSKKENCFCMQKSIAYQDTFFHCVE